MGEYNTYEDKTLEELITLPENIFLTKVDGYLTLLRFGTD